MESTSLRTKLCSNINIEDKAVSLCGWVQTIRDHGKLYFLEVRDYSGFIQVVVNLDNLESELINKVKSLKKEYCVLVKGIVKKRDEDLINNKIKTGTIEVVLEDLEILGESKQIPFEINEDTKVSDELILKYRYLYLRRNEAQNRLRLRSKAALKVRNFLTEDGFIEIETPFLIKSTPEGARDFVVPSRVNKGKFYALPQSPQLYKQILMVSNFDRYFQFAKCFRDEDLRTDRQPEFTQLDIEMSFIDYKDIKRVVEGIVCEFCDVFGKEKPSKFDIINYYDALDKYSTDRPDTRFDLFTHNISTLFEGSSFKTFSDLIKNKGIVKCIGFDKSLSRKEIDEYTEYCKLEGAKGLAYVKVINGSFDSGISKFIDDKQRNEILERTKIKNGTIFFVGDKPDLCNDIISKLRVKLGYDLDLIDESKLNFVWVVNFPLFVKTEDGGFEPSHHMFTMPKKEFLGENEWKEPEKVLSEQYDLVLNGFEIAGGSIRCHRKDLQSKIMNVVGFPLEKAKERFGFLLDALDYGAPPHGGIAFGFDRVVALLTGTKDIRETMAFPKNKKAQNPMDNSPSAVDKEQLSELGLKLEK